MAVRQFNFRDRGAEVQDPKNGSVIQAPFAACRDVTRCGSLYLAGNAGFNFNVREGCNKSPVTYLQGNESFLVIGDTPNVPGMVQPDTNMDDKFLGLRNFAIAAALPGANILGDPAQIAPGTWGVRGASWVQTVNSANFGTGEMELTVTFPRITPVMDQCGNQVGIRAKASATATYLDEDCSRYLYYVLSGNYAWSNTAFTTRATIFGAVSQAMAQSYGDPGAIPPAGADSCPTLSIDTIGTWRTNTAPGLIADGFAITDNLPESADGNAGGGGGGVIT